MKTLLKYTTGKAMIIVLASIIVSSLISIFGNSFAWHFQSTFIVVILGVITFINAKKKVKADTLHALIILMILMIILSVVLTTMIAIAAAIANEWILFTYCLIIIIGSVAAIIELIDGRKEVRSQMNI